MDALDNAGLKYTTEEKPGHTAIRIENIGLLRIYHTKKGDKIDYSQLPAHFKQRIMDIMEPLSNEKVLGVDEAGKGDFFGPLVAAAAFVPEPAVLRSIGVADSKRLKDENIIELAAEIKKRCFVSVVKINPPKYNELYAKFDNLNRMLAWAHSTAIENSLKEIQPDYILTDKFANEQVLESMLGELGRKAKIVQKTKAESNISVAAASIIARAEFVLSLQKLSFEYGMELPLGAGDPVLKAAKVFSEKFGKDNLRKVAKLHFRTLSMI